MENEKDQAKREKLWYEYRFETTPRYKVIDVHSLSNTYTTQDV